MRGMTYDEMREEAERREEMLYEDRLHMQQLEEEAYQAETQRAGLIPQALEIKLDEARARIAELEAQHDELLAACELGDFLGGSGPDLLEWAAELVKPFAPTTAKELQLKAEAERAVIEKARGENDGR